MEAANFALRYCPEAKRFYERKKRKSNGIVAIKAVAHKLARACYHMLREQKPFDVPPYPQYAGSMAGVLRAQAEETHGVTAQAQRRVPKLPIAAC